MNQPALRWAEVFTYLGIKISRDFRAFQRLNLQPIVACLKDHCSRWASLPLNLLGRINILKMIYLPKLNYIFRNCPTWIPQKFFKEIDVCIGAFLWRGSSPRIAKSTLQLPVRCGGLALPNLLVYYWAAVLVTVRWWFEQSRANAAVCLEAAMVGSLKELGNLVYRGASSSPALADPTRTTLRVWGVARKRYLVPNRWSPYCPLWGNPNLPHFRTVPDPQVWAWYGVKVLKDIVSSGILVSFQDLVVRCGLPEGMLFRYYQLRHAFRAQFPTPPDLLTDGVEELLAQESLVKSLSSLYLTLLSTD